MDCTPERLAVALDELLTDEARRKVQIDGLAEVGGWLGQGQFIPSERAAETVLRLVDLSPVKDMA